MTPQEQSMLGDLTRRVQQTQLTEKDPEAQQFLDAQLGGHPDALYVLAQTVLVQKYALEQAQKQIEQLKQQPAPAPAKPTSFLGSIFGHSDPESKPQANPQTYAQQPPPYTPVNAPQYAQPQYAQAQYAQTAYGAPAPSGGSSFLRSAATTAAGVAAGALAFEGVESLMHGFGHSAGYGEGGFGGGGFGEGGFGGRPEETVINNYYDEPGGRESGREGEHGGQNAGYDAGSDHDSGSRDSDLQPQLDQADDVNVGNEDGGGSYDDASLDASDGGDFGGGDDSNFA